MIEYAATRLMLLSSNGPLYLCFYFCSIESIIKHIERAWYGIGWGIIFITSIEWKQQTLTLLVDDDDDDVDDNVERKKSKQKKCLASLQIESNWWFTSKQSLKEGNKHVKTIQCTIFPCAGLNNVHADHFSVLTSQKDIQKREAHSLLPKILFIVR